MKALPVALQLYTVREDVAADMIGTIRRVARLGYDGVEFAGFFQTPAADIAAALAQTGLAAVSAHIGIEGLEDPSILAYVKALKLPYVAIPYVGEPMRPGAQGYADFLRRAAAASVALKAFGCQLLYHNHAFEFAKVDGLYALDKLYLDLSPDQLQTELDTCWVNRGGEDPAAYLRRYKGRAPVVHLKDFVSAPEFDFRPVGDGEQDLPALLQASNDAGASWLVVEQDRCPTYSAMQSAQRSLENIRKAQEALA